MLFKSKKRENVVGVLNDLIGINTGRIAVYQKVIDDHPYDDDNLKALFDEIISNASSCKKELIDKVENIGLKHTLQIAMPGKIYQAWLDLVVGFNKYRANQNTLINSCQYNEGIALHAYTAALNPKVDLGDDVRQMLEQQQKGIQTVCEHVKQRRSHNHIFNTAAAYFN